MYDIDFSWAPQEAGGKWKSYTCIQCCLGMWRMEARGLGLAGLTCCCITPCPASASLAVKWEQSIFISNLLEFFGGVLKSAWMGGPSQIPRGCGQCLGAEGRVGSKWVVKLPGVHKPDSLRPRFAKPQAPLGWNSASLSTPPSPHPHLATIWHFLPLPAALALFQGLIFLGHRGWGIFFQGLHPWA